jgi:signal peptidase I
MEEIGGMHPEPGETVHPDQRGQSLRATVREIVETILLTLAVFFLIRTVVQNFHIDGYSMEPTLHTGQYLIINKLVYLWHQPDRGDIVVFEYPRAPNRDFIKRVIGLPGEKIEVKQSKVYINDKPLEESYVASPPLYSWGPVVVGPNEYCVLGDNRNNSSDSHTWGMLPRANIVGQAWLSYWPPQYWGVVSVPSYAASK